MTSSPTGSRTTIFRQNKRRRGSGQAYALYHLCCVSLSTNLQVGRLAVDKGVVNRFIKHAIAQVKIDRPPGQDEGTSSPAQGSNVHIPVKVTTKMVARAQYERELQEAGSEEEDDLEVFNEASESETTAGTEPSPRKSKGKERADDDRMQTAPSAGQKRRRPQMDPFAGTYSGRSST